MSHHFKRYHTHSRGYRPRRHRGRLRVGRLILLVLIFAAIIFGIVLGVMFLTKTGFFAEKDASASVPAEIPAGYEAPVQTAEAGGLPPSSPPHSVLLSKSSRTARQQPALRGPKQSPSPLQAIIRRFPEL